MENLWNQRDLKPPPVYTIKCRNINLNIDDLKSTCSELWNSLKNNETLFTEVALLSRLIYKNRNKLRFDKGFQNIRKVYRCLRRYVELNIDNKIENFTLCLPDTTNDTFLYLPSQQMLEYLLVRLMGLARLLHQICIFCVTAAQYLHQERIQLGHSWSLAIIFLAVTARIWSICESWVQIICRSYNKIINYQTKLPSSNAVWLPAQFSFPADLRAWLGIAKTHKRKEVQVPEKIFQLLVDDDEEDESDVVTLVTPSASDSDDENYTSILQPASTSEAQSSSTESRVHSKIDSRGPSSSVYSRFLDEDLGESLNEDDNIRPAPTAADKFWNSEQQQKIKFINNVDDLINFMQQHFRHGDPCHGSKRKQLKKIVKKIKMATKKDPKKNVNSLICIAKNILIKQE